MLALITATRNSMSTLEITLASATALDLDYFHVFVDADSSDGTREVLQTYCNAHRNTELISQQGAGLYEALNEGILCALGNSAVTHIALLHSDDELIPATYAKFANSVVQDGYDVAYSDIQFHNSKNETVRVWNAGHLSPLKLHTGWMPPHTSMIAARRVYETLGLYDPSFGTAADYEWVVRVLTKRALSVFYFPARTLSMRTGGASGKNIRARLRANATDGRVWKSRSILLAVTVRVCKPMRKVFQFFRPSRTNQRVRRHGAPA